MLIKIEEQWHSSKPNEKLAPRFYGLYMTVQCMGKVAYKLDHPTTSYIHSLFLVSQLRKAEGAKTT